MKETCNTSTPELCGILTQRQRRKTGKNAGTWKFSVHVKWISLEEHACLLQYLFLKFRWTHFFIWQPRVYRHTHDSVTCHITQRKPNLLIPGAEAGGKERLRGPRQPVLRFPPVWWCTCCKPARPPASAAQLPKQTCDQTTGVPQGKINILQDFISVGHLSRVWDKCSVWSRLTLWVECSSPGAFRALGTVSALKPRLS